MKYYCVITKHTYIVQYMHLCLSKWEKGSLIRIITKPNPSLNAYGHPLLNVIGIFFWNIPLAKIMLWKSVSKKYFLSWKTSTTWYYLYCKITLYKAHCDWKYFHVMGNHITEIHVRQGMTVLYILFLIFSYLMTFQWPRGISNININF